MSRLLTMRVLGVRLPMVVFIALLGIGAVTGDARWTLAGFAFAFAVVALLVVLLAVAAWREQREARAAKLRAHLGTPDDPRLDPAERAIPITAQVSAEDALNASFGLPEVWRCPCGGRPFVTEASCPRCGRDRTEGWKV